MNYLNIENQALSGDRYAIISVVNALRRYREAADKVIEDGDMEEFKEAVEELRHDIGDDR